MRYDAVTPLLAVGHAALAWGVGRDLLGEPLEPQSLWELPRVVHAVRCQNEDGSWSYRGGRLQLRSRADYAQLATYQQLLVLVSQYRLDRRHPMIARAASAVLRFQTHEGDIRGIYGSQYTPNYTADLLRLLIEAGYADDRRVLRGMDWLLALRQDDGGWAIPLRTAGSDAFVEAMKLPRPLAPDRTRPSSHLVTGIVLRAFAAHPAYRSRPEARRAALLLASRFFEPDRYADRKDAAYWTKLAFPFRWTDVVSSLDSLAQIGVEASEPHAREGLRWLLTQQRPTGLWSCGYENSADPLSDQWVTFAAARALKRFYGPESLNAGRARPSARHPRTGRTAAGVRAAVRRRRPSPASAGARRASA